MQLGPTESAHGFGDTVSCLFCPWLQLKNGQGCLYMHLVRHHGPERRFVYSGAKQLRAVMALHQRDLFRGRRPADFLARSAELIRCSGALAARRVGNVFNDRVFADVFLRHLMQTRGRMHMTMNHLQCDIQLQGCQPGHLVPEQPKTMRPVAEDIVHSPDVSA